MNCDKRTEQWLLYAADALEPQQQQELDRHLEAGCERCEHALAEARATLAQLALSLDPVAPPDSARQRLRARIRTEKPAPDQSPQPRPQPAQGAIRLRFSRWAVPAGSAALAAAITIAALLVPLVRQHRELTTVRDRLATIEQRLQNADSRQSFSLAPVASATRTLVEALASSALQVVSLKGNESNADAWGRLFWDRDRNTCYVYASKLPSSSQPSTYTLWLFNGEGTPVRAGSFRLSGEDSRWVQIELTRRARQVTTPRKAVISHDGTDGGSQTEQNQPQNPILAGNLSE